MATTTAAIRRVRQKSVPAARWGLEVRILWGERILAEHFLHAGEARRFSIGNDAGVDFATGTDDFGSSRFDVIESTPDGFFLHFTHGMRGALFRGGEESGLSTHAEEDGDGRFSIAIASGDAAYVELGTLRLEVATRRAPRPVVVPLEDSLDFKFLSIAVVVFFIVAAFAVSAFNRDVSDTWADELTMDQQHIVKVLLSAPPKTNPLVEKMNQQKQQHAEAPAASKGASGRAGQQNVKDHPGKVSLPQDPKALAKKLTDGLFGGHGGIFGEKSNNALNVALNDVKSTEFGASNGMGLGLKGDKNGGGGDNERAEIGAIGTKGKSTGVPDYGANAANLCCKDPGVTPTIAPDDFQLKGSLDRELIRQVIHEHRSQIRFCYESQLNRAPKLSGKVTAKFVIGENGSVMASEIASSTMGDASVESCVRGRVKTWIFPKPKGGGSVLVSYPFVFTRSGE